MSSRSRSHRPSRGSSPPPHTVASGSRSRDQEPTDRRRQGARGRSRSRSPRYERWTSYPSDGWRNPPPRSGRSRIRNRTPPRASGQRSSARRHDDRDDRHGRGEGRREARERSSYAPSVRRQMSERTSDNTVRSRARSSPPAQTMRTRRLSRSLSPPGYRSRPGPPLWQEQGGRGEGQSYSRRSQSSDASMRSASPPFPPLDIEPSKFRGRGARDFSQDQPRPRSRNRDTSQIPLEINPLSLEYESPSAPLRNYGSTTNISNAGNVFTGTNYGVVIMKSITVQPSDDFMLRLAERLKICVRADYRYFAPDNEAGLRRGQCTPGTHVSVLRGITDWAISLSTDGEVVFWLSGQAGAGKTTIACTIAHHLETLANDGTSKVALGATFFCSRQFPDTRSPSSIIRTIVYQLSVNSKSFRMALQEHGKFDTVDHGPRSQIMGLLIRPWKASAPARLENKEPCYVVPIDALDELEGVGGTEFLGVLFDAVSQQDLSGLKFLVTSRLEPALVKQIASFPNKQVCRLEEMPLEASSADIKTFLSTHLAQCATPEQIDQLVSDAAGLFIHAATVVEYVKERDVGEQKSLIHRLLSTSSVRRPSRAATAMLDNLYLQILETSLVDPRERDDPEIFEDCLSILHTFLCTIERTSTLVAVDILNARAGSSDALLDDGIAKGVLYRLHAVLYSQGGLVMSYHKSFADFLFDAGRAQRFFCNQEQHHRRLAEGCFEIMKTQLRFNMADIPTSYVMDCDNPKLQASVDANISTSLRYTGRRWSDHLALTGPRVDTKDGLAETLHQFLRLPVLFWMELMNLLRQRGRCQVMLRIAQRWSSRTKNSKDLVQQLSDAALLSAYHSTSKAALSVPHLYLSSLATFYRDTAAVQGWRMQFGGIPAFIAPGCPHGKGSGLEVTRINVAGMWTFAVSPDGVHIVVGTSDGLVMLDLSTAEEVLTLKVHAQVVAFSSDGKHIAVSLLGKNSIRVLNSHSGEEDMLLEGHTGEVRAVAYSPDGSHLISGSDDQTVRVWDVSARRAARTLEGHAAEVYAVCYSPDGSHIVSGSCDKSIRVWNSSTAEMVRVLQGHTEWVMAVSYSPDGSHIVSCSMDSTVRVWDVMKGEQIVMLEGHTGFVLTVAYSPDGTHIVSGSDDSTVRVWDVCTGEEVLVITGHAERVCAVAYLPDGSQVVSRSADMSVRVWDVSLGEKRKDIKDSLDSPNAFAFLPDGSQAIAGSSDKRRVWDLATGMELRALGGRISGLCALAYAPGGAYAVSASDDNIVRVWDASTGDESNVFRGHTDQVHAVAYTPDGSCIVSGSGDRSIRVWDASTGVELKVLEGHKGPVMAVACSPDGNHIVSASDDASVRVWNLHTGEEERVLEGHARWVCAVAYSPDGSCIVSGSSDQSIQVWDVATGDNVNVLGGHTGSVLAVSYSPDGSHIVSGSDDKSVRVWNSTTGDNVLVLNGHTDAVRAVAYMPGGTHIVSGSSDGTIRLWNVSPEYSLRYSREQDPDGEYTGWLVSPTDPSSYLMFIRPDTLLPDDLNVRTIPSTSVPHLDLSTAKIGDRWVECYKPRSS